jgi:hypothetical protein
MASSHAGLMVVRTVLSLIDGPGTEGTEQRMEKETKRAGISQSRPIIYKGESCAHSISTFSIPWPTGSLVM